MVLFLPTEEEAAPGELQLLALQVQGQAEAEVLETVVPLFMHLAQHLH
jgi:hypothetical protein